MKFLRGLIRIYYFLILFLPGLVVVWATLSHLSPKILFDKLYLSAFKQSLLIASSTMVTATSLGTLCAILIARFRFPARRLWIVLHTLPLFFVPYQFALAWSLLLPSGWPSHLLFSPAGVIFVLTGNLYPLAFWFSLVAFVSVPPEEEESALLVRPPRKVFWHITFRRSLPYLTGAALLIFLLAFSEIGVPTYLGVNVLPGEVLTRFAAFYDFHGAMTTAFPLAILSLGLFFLEKHLFERLSFPGRIVERGLVFRAGPWQAAAALFFLISVAMVFLLIPFGALGHKAFNLESLSLALSQGWRSLGWSLFYGFLAASLAAVWSFLSRCLIGSREQYLLSWLTLLNFFLPPVILAVGLIYFWGKLSPWLYGTSFLLVAGLLARFSFLPYQILSAAHQNLDPSAEEAAILGGASRLRIVQKILFPQMRKWFYLGLMLVFVFSLNELGLSTLLYPPGAEPLVVRLYTLSVNNPLGVSAALALMNSLTTLGVVIILWRKSLDWSR